MKSYYCLFLLLVESNLNAQVPAQKDSLPPPFATKSVMNFSNVIGWEDDEKPKAPEGFQVNLFAAGFENPRWLYELPNGDILVAESNSEHSALEKVGGPIIGASKSNNLSASANRITILRDSDKDGMPEFRDTFLTGLKQPFGMLLLNNWLYVANTDALLRFPYKEGETRITMKGQKILDLPAGEHNRHWTRNIIANKNGTKIYVAIGSGSNVAENGMDVEILRACIIEINPDGSGRRVYASGLRNPVGMDWAPATNVLWAAVNERDELGDDLVPDYITGVKPDGFYGWPYSYFGQHIDPRIKEQKPEMVKKAIVPDVALGSHTASLGLAFYKGKSFPEKYRNGAFVAQHGSWNRSVLSGYKVVFIPFVNGKPSGVPVDFLTGFIADLESGKVHGRPVCVIFTKDGSMLLSDDTSNRVWRISASQSSLPD
jgi:glucose/arabinose dehydrogenase